MEHFGADSSRDKDITAPKEASVATCDESPAEVALSPTRVQTGLSQKHCANSDGCYTDNVQVATSNDSNIVKLVLVVNLILCK